MTSEIDNRIDAALKCMLGWDAESPRIWERALVPAAPAARRVRPRLLAIAAPLLLGALVVGAILIPARGVARRTAAPAVGAPIDRLAIEAMPDASARFGSLSDKEFAPMSSGRLVLDDQQLQGLSKSFEEQAEFRQLASRLLEQPQRLVERRATLEIEVANARAAYVKARALVSEARGEFVQGGRISEQGEQHRADLVLRVQAARLDEVLDALRSLGTVKDERLDAADVTEQMVDLEARLSNERRIETELLGLLDKRPDDKLEDILRVRAELAGVRERIERLVAQRANLASLVALSTITVLMAEPAEKPAVMAAEEGLWSSFKHDLGDAWRSGVEALLRFVVWLVEIAIAGLPLWLITAGAVVLAWRSYRRHRPRPLPV